LITARQLNEWIAVPAEELAARARTPFVLVKERSDVHEMFADDLWGEIHTARAEGREVSLIVPLGPVGQYPLLAKHVNEERLPLGHVTFFGMDEWLDWQGRPFTRDHPFSLEGRFHRLFIDLIEPDLRPQPENVIFPTPLALDRSSEELARRNNLALTCGGVGFQGHVAFNEPPASRWTSVTAEELRDSQTRLVPLAVDTVIAHAQRSAGGNVFAVPPMAITLGMRDMLAARRVRLYIDTGTWKRTILRILLFADADVDYPATLFSSHPDVRVVADRDSAAAPLAAQIGSLDG
jgi:glucosamine-6-phosphate deaminase